MICWKNLDLKLVMIGKCFVISVLSEDERSLGVLKEFVLE